MNTVRRIAQIIRLLKTYHELKQKEIVDLVCNDRSKIRKTKTAVSRDCALAVEQGYLKLGRDNYYRLGELIIIKPI